MVAAQRDAKVRMLECPAQANGIVGAFRPDRVVWVQGHRDVVLLGLLEQAVEKPKRRLVSCGIGGGERAGGEGKIQMPCSAHSGRRVQQATMIRRGGREVGHRVDAVTSSPNRLSTSSSRRILAMTARPIGRVVCRPSPVRRAFASSVETVGTDGGEARGVHRKDLVHRFAISTCCGRPVPTQSAIARTQEKLNTARSSTKASSDRPWTRV